MCTCYFHICFIPRGLYQVKCTCTVCVSGFSYENTMLLEISFLQLDKISIPYHRLWNDHFNPVPHPQKLQNALPPIPSEFQHHFKLLLPFGISSFFSPFGIFFDCLKLPLNGKLVLFPPPSKFYSQF